MAIYNEILSPRYARSLQKLFGIKGSVPSKQLSGEIMPIHAVFSGRENRYLEDWQTFGAVKSVSAVAAQDDVIRFSNPLGSNIIAVVESIRVWSGSTAEAFLEFAATGNNGILGLSVTPAAFDSRRLPPGTGNNQAAALLSGTNNIGQGNHVVFDDIPMAANVMSNELINFESQEIVVLPGADFQMRTLTVNITATMIVKWRERLLEESERA